MSSETSKKPRLKAVEGGKILSFQERAEQIIAEAKRKEEEEVQASLARLAEIRQGIADAKEAVLKAPDKYKELVEADMQKNIEVLEEERAELLKNPEVQIKHIQGLIEELQECKNFNRLDNIVEAAASRGWVTKPTRHPKTGYVIYNELRKANVKENPQLAEFPELDEACVQLIREIQVTFKRINQRVKDRQRKKKAKEASQKEGFVVRPKATRDSGKSQRERKK